MTPRNQYTGPRVTNEEIIAAYQQTGSVWKSAKIVGITGQTVHARLSAIGYKTGSGWSPEEVERLRELVGQATIGVIADEFGRSYASIACKINELGVGTRFGNGLPKKPPRGAGLDKATMKRHTKMLEQSGMPVTRYARQSGMHVETFIRALEYHFPEWWQEYRKGITYLPESQCPNCDSSFYRSNTRQQFCSRRCQGAYRVDQDYFGGKRKNTIGLAEGVCQICGRTPKKALSSHHVIGKENDPENDFLVALCSGCHNIVTQLGSRNFTENQWESLISFVWLRKNGADAVNESVSLHVCVDIDVDDSQFDEDEVEEFLADAEVNL